MTNNFIKCPQCGNEFAVDEAIFQQAEEKLQAEYKKKQTELIKKMTDQQKKLETEKEILEQKKANQDTELQKLLNKEKKKLESEAKAKLREEFETQLKTLQEENQQRKEENKLLKSKELELLRKEAILKERAEELKVEAEKEILRKRDEIVREIQLKEKEKNELRVKEYEKKLADQKKLIDEMNRKADQGSMQMQGEVMELALENLLRTQHPFDIIEEVGKGIRGADVIQTVRNKLGQNCGKIIYESKRTKNFGSDWIEKLKNDQREQQADIAVIVTETMPKDMNHFGNKDNIWICTFAEVKGLSFVLREILIKTQSVKSADENRADKMNLLYNYLTGNEFAQSIEAIVDGFSSMKNELDREKRAMHKIWKEREKQIDKVVGNTIDMYGSIKGIAGKSIETVQALELPGSEFDD